MMIMLDLMIALPIALLAVFLLFSAAYSSLNAIYEAGSYEKNVYVYSNLSQNAIEYGLLNPGSNSLYPLNNRTVYLCRENFCRVVCLDGKVYLWVLDYENAGKP